MGEDEIIEDIAESYLIELLERCIIQVGDRHADMRINTCRIHDLMRDFCLSKAKEETFLDIIDNQGHMHTFASHNYCARRLAFHISCEIKHVKNPHLRTLMFFKPLLYDDDVKGLPEGSLIQKAFAYSFEHESEKNFKTILAVVLFCCLYLRDLRPFISYILNNFGKLRVLHLQGETQLPCNELKNVGSLIHLRYFCLKGARVSKLPSSLGKLSCLLTLDLRNNFPIPLIPDVIWRMEQLRHLFFPENFRSESKLRMSNLRNLQTLVNFSTTNCHLGDICFLTNLRELSMRGFAGYEDDMDAYCAEHCCTFFAFVIEAGSRYIGLEEDPMLMLGKLPNLRILGIEAGAFSVEEMICSTVSFAQLESLSLDSLDKLAELKIDKGAMTNLQHLKIRNCQQLKMLPTGFRSITALKKVDIEEMPTDFVDWRKN